MKRYTLPERIGTLSKEDLGEEMRKRSTGKFGTKEAESLISLARETVGIKEGLAGIFMDIRHILMHLDAEMRFLSEIEAEMRAYLRCFLEAAMPKISNLSHPFMGYPL